MDQNENQNLEIIKQALSQKEVAKDRLNDLELAKIIINKIFDNDNLMSTTSLHRYEIEDISNAIVLNHIFQNSMIHAKIDSFMKLKRSEEYRPVSLLSLLLKDISEKDPSRMEQFKEFVRGSR